ncbi:capsular polysaccharide synthesis protein [Citrobacter sp. S2-9]|uniref:Capsular polysaccharide synthesis protein n=1 Tax=Citrobacter enshiensis TaxID=2971264 RepID=A0ABT8PSF5_9ENTR|nr:glycosyltransferase [Citrobacter enshiensis]MDN8598429.1 capsular polysaccharide synthesis protein [Citrobacter enshiensis]
MHIYTYWVNQNNSDMPVYLKLCMRSWYKAIPGAKICLINQANIMQFLPKTLLTASFFNLPLAMQSDVVSVWVLLSRGGLFLDVDTIMTRNPFTNNVFNPARLCAFGYEERKQIHLAVMFSQQRKNALLYAWITEVAKKLAKPLPSPLPWDWVGNSIINILLREPSLQESVQILDAGDYGNILELSITEETPFNRYMKYYFTPPVCPLEETILKVKGGMISLHNSWTPEIYRKATLQEIVKSRDSLMLSHLLVNILEP